MPPGAVKEISGKEGNSNCIGCYVGIAFTGSSRNVQTEKGVKDISSSQKKPVAESLKQMHFLPGKRKKSPEAR